ncbi:sensor domain-containing diguanylate cyclase [Actinoplanes aureus]|uniref:GGDEF domain-containing protein n=1 Tax=Actinoplanes aureus TaxID=2792083 RepID=A0A931CDT0_9ACTN|nr:sensor domain-containing diguanylate cyclase [Actinoplanes aureus]MBG0566132.1 GGDEF domain-containing protein [Actinoplanes aureus]
MTAPGRGAPVPLLRDPVLAGLAVAGIVLVAGYGLDLGSPRAQLLAGWLIMPVLDLLIFVYARQAARVATARLWRALSVAGLLFFAGDSFQLAITIADPAADHLVFHPLQTASALTGALLAVGAGMIHPTGSWTRPARIRFVLDTAIVTSAAAVVAWCLITRPDLAAADLNDFFTAVFGTGLLLAGVFTVAKMILSGSSPIVAQAAGPLMAAAAGQGLSNALLPSSELGDLVGVQILLVILPCLLAAVAVRIQVLRPAGAARAPRRTGSRRYSVLPYAGTVTSVITLVIVLASSGLGLSAWGALAGLLVNVGLVVARQLVALAENSTLLVRLDESLAEIRRREFRLESLLRHSSDVTTIIGTDGSFAYLSPAVERMLGVPASTVVGRQVLDAMHGDDARRLGDDLARLLTTPGAELTFEARVRNTDGTWRWLEAIAVNLADEPGIAGVVINARDVTEARELRERLRFQAGHDTLTGLANRRLFADRIREAGRAAATAAVLLVDLNRFKHINDTYGHATGDAVLRHVADRLRECAGPADLPARLGGDEFAVLVGGDDPEAAGRLAAGFRQALAAPFRIDGHNLTVSASVGLATGPATDPGHLLHVADLRMYEEKQRSQAWAT